MPAYGNLNIFGSAVSMVTIDRPRDRQVNTFFGVNGVEFIDGGSRGRITEVEGLLIAESISMLAKLEEQFRLLADGQARTLVDTLGVSWTSVILESFQPQGKIRQSSQGLFFRPYKAFLFHLQ